LKFSVKITIGSIFLTPFLFYHAPLPGAGCVTIWPDRLQLSYRLSNVRFVFAKSPPPCLLAFTAWAETVSLASLCIRLLTAPSAKPFIFVHSKIIHILYLALLDIADVDELAGAKPVTE
jgi:hypothetical protein